MLIKLNVGPRLALVSLHVWHSLISPVLVFELDHRNAILVFVPGAHLFLCLLFTNALALDDSVNFICIEVVVLVKLFRDAAQLFVFFLQKVLDPLKGLIEDLLDFLVDLGVLVL